VSRGASGGGCAWARERSGGGGGSLHAEETRAAKINYWTPESVSPTAEGGGD